MTSRAITTEHLRRLFETGRLVTMSDLRALHDEAHRTTIRRLVASGDLPRPLGSVGQTEVWDKEEVLDYMIRRRG